uniref:SWIM-type domain-containing protein n=1 Tax=Lactuca sativa TaxID=4236 RepID=A0A9R1W9V9_LACSA|nr:hypothetical protein LSAT_V11C300149490 [Lactuca sativa]
MLEEIQLYMMERFYNLKEEGQKWDTEICPVAIKKMEAFGESLKSWYVHPSGVTAFEVRNGFYSYCVNLQEYSCTCNLWAVSGIPCVHAQATIMYTQQDPVSYISSWFSKEKLQVNEEEINVEEVNDEDTQEIMRSNTQESRMRKTQQIRRRKPSERITELKLKKQVVSKFGMTESTPLNLE